jgi:hypothetical protein
MKNLATYVSLVTLCVGCSRRPDIPEAKCLVFTTLNNHRITTWVNDEPVLVCGSVYNGYNKPFWVTLGKGWNTVYFTAERLPSELTGVIAQQSPDGRNDGTTTVRIIKGGIFSPQDLLVWQATEDEQTSPRWTVSSDKGYRPPLEAFEDIGTVDEDARKQVAAFLRRLVAALEGKDPAAVGWRETDMEFLMKEAGMTGFGVRDIFNQEHYGVTVSAMDDLKIIHGRKTIMAYRRDGGEVFFAGRSRTAPKETGTGCYYSLGWDALYFVKRNGRLEPLWVKDY